MKPIAAAAALLLACAACGPVPQPDSLRTVAAIEVPLRTSADRDAFLHLMRREAEASGFHLDAADADELAAMSAVSPITLNATIWRGADDEEPEVSAMDSFGHPGRIWVSFARGDDPGRSTALRMRLTRSIVKRWPQSARLPIMPNGAIPLAEDLVRTPSGYAVSPSEQAKYEVRAPRASP